MRNFLAILVGIVVAMLIVGMFDKVPHYLFSIPDMKPTASRNEMKAFIDQMPLAAKLLMALGWGIAAFCGGIVSTLICKTGKMPPAIIVGLLFFAATLVNLFMLPHPWYMWILGLWMPVPMAYWGSTFVNNYKR